jgi:hypothetical protein
VFRLLVLISILPVALQADLTAVKSESRLERRSELALEHALATVDRAREAWRESKDQDFKEALDEIREAAELSYQSLLDTGKPARRHPKYFKRAEKNLRALMRKLDAFAQEVGVEQRTAIEELRKRTSDLHDQIVLDIMTKKK